MASLRSSPRCSPRLGPTHRRRALSPTPIINWLLFWYGVPAASFALAGCFAPGGRHVRQSNTWTRRHTLDVNALADRQGARPHHLGGAIQAELRAASIPQVILCQRLCSGIKLTVLRDRTEFPVKHAQLLDQEPPSHGNFLTRCRVSESQTPEEHAMKMNLTIVTLKMLMSLSIFAGGLSLASASSFARNDPTYASPN